MPRRRPTWAGIRISRSIDRSCRRIRFRASFGPMARSGPWGVFCVAPVSARFAAATCGPNGERSIGASSIWSAGRRRWSIAISTCRCSRRAIAPCSTCSTPKTPAPTCAASLKTAPALACVPVLASTHGAVAPRPCAARRAAAHGLPGCDWLIGVTDPACVVDDRYLDRWLGQVGTNGSVEVCCHPGYHDESLIGRDCDAGDGLLRRPRETRLLRSPSFLAACADAGLVPARPSAIPGSRAGGP